MTQRWNGKILLEHQPAGQGDTAPEIALWAAVLVQAIRDACGVGNFISKKPDKAAHQRDQARAWLLRGGKNFRLVCGGAGYDPARIRAGMERLEAAGWPPEALLDREVL